MTVRALHHYDEIGLLSPSGRSDAGYRLYSYEDLIRLQEILVWRRLGFSLTEIAALLDDPSYDRSEALRRQRLLVEREAERLGAIQRALDAAVAAHVNGTRLKETTMFEGFDNSQYKDEVRERWGDTDAYRESTRRAAGYGEPEWRAIRTESEEIVRGFASLMAAGEPAAGAAARAVAERHRQHDLALVLSVLAADAPRARGDVRRRRAVCAQLRSGRRGAGRLHARGDRGQRRRGQ